MILLFLDVLICIPPLVITHLNECLTYATDFYLSFAWTSSLLLAITLVHSVSFHSQVNYKIDGGKGKLAKKRYSQHFMFQFIEEISLYLVMSTSMLIVNQWAFHLSVAYLALYFFLIVLAFGLYAASFWSRVYAATDLGNDGQNPFAEELQKNWKCLNFLLVLDIIWMGILFTNFSLVSYFHPDLFDNPSRPPLTKCL